MIGSKYTRTCVKCKKEFDVKILRNGMPSRRRTCSEECRRKRASCKTIRWSKDELAYLESLSQSLPIIPLVRSYNLWASRNNFERRTIGSIQSKLLLTFGTSKATYDWYTFTELGELFAIKSSRVRSWTKISNKPLETYQRRKGRGTNLINRHQFQQFAKNHPERLGGVRRHGLLIILEDEKWVDKILKTYPVKTNGQYKSKKIRCLKTNKVYPSIGSVTRALPVTHKQIVRAIDAGRPCNGHYLEYVTW